MEHGRDYSLATAEPVLHPGAMNSWLNRIYPSTFFGIVVATALAFGCGGGQPEATQPTNPSSNAAPDAAPSASTTEITPPAASAAPTATASSAPAPAAPSGPPGPGEWASWSHDQKLAYMKSAVMPQMGTLFHEYDAKKYDEPKCVLCHGAGVKDGTFKMPNPELPKLDLSPAGFKKMHTKNAAVVEFMGKKVVPQMAQLLGEQPFDPKTGQGFGCLECHVKADAKDAKSTPKGDVKK